MAGFKKYSFAEGQLMNGSSGEICLFDPFEERRSSFLRKRDLDGTKYTFKKEHITSVVTVMDIGL